MKQIVTMAIVLSRTEYGEADRIVTLLTPEYGKIRVLARGVRKIKSKLAGGIELFSISSVTCMQGRGELQTLISARLQQHYGKITTDIDRVQLGYECIKLLNKATEDNPESAYFDLLQQVFAALDNVDVPLLTIRPWFLAQLVRLSGSEPNFRQNADGSTLQADQRYSFDTTQMLLIADQRGALQANTIKFLRLLFGKHDLANLLQIQDAPQYFTNTQGLIETIFRAQL